MRNLQFYVSGKKPIANGLSEAYVYILILADRVRRIKNAGPTTSTTGFGFIQNQSQYLFLFRKYQVLLYYHG